jgi:hypothetical protein
MKKYAMLICTAAFAVCSVSSREQVKNFNYKKAPEKYFHIDNAKHNTQADINNKFPNAYDLSKSLPANCVKDGSVDYTTYLQQGLDNNSVVCFPNFPVLINNKGLLLKSNSTIIFKSKSALILAPNDQPAYSMLKIAKVQNVNVYYPVLIGDRDKHSGTKGEWGMGIWIESAQNVKIYDSQISKCWGDGIYIAGTSAQNSSNILIQNPELDFNRRNGISIVSGTNISINNGVISNTYGTWPMSGIDFEPDGKNNDIDSVTVKNLTTFNNVGSGILMVLMRLQSEQAKHVNINIDGHVDDGSVNAFRVVGFKPTLANAQPLNGNINITNSKWIDNKQPFQGNDTYDFCPNINLKNISILKQKAGAQNYEEDRSSMASIKRDWGTKNHIKIQ